MRRLVLLVAVTLVVLSAIPAYASNDPEFAKQYGPQQIQAPLAWTKTRAANILIAVVDSGVDVDHPDLRPKLVVRAGSDFGDGDDNPDDDSNVADGSGAQVRGHGTHVAGTAAAVTDNGIGIAGVAADAKILPVKVFGSNDNLLNVLTRIPSAIRYAVDNGARVINLSLGTFQGLSLVGLIETPCAEAFQRGALCVLAAGNSGSAQSSGYAKNVQALVVTANDKSEKHAGFGQKADTQWALSAPGVDILSTWPVEDGSYTRNQGTSMAAPHAAGAVALLLAQGFTPQQAIDRLLSTAKPMGDPGTNGAGIVQVGAASGLTPPPVGSPAAAPTAAGAANRPAAAATATTRPRTTATTTATTRPLPGEEPLDDDDFAFAGSGNVASTEDDEVAFGGGEKARRVSTGALVAVLVALTAIGVAWPTMARARARRPAPAPPAT